MRTPRIRSAAWLFAVLAAAPACERPPIDTVQQDFRGVGVVHLSNPRILAQRVAANIPPEASPQVAPTGTLARDVYQNVQVLGDLDVAEFNRTMVAMTAWVSPEQGCTYCHAGANLAVDSPYTKVVARQMIQMTRHINSNWRQHVGETGVTCWTCHMGANVPGNVWTQAVPRAAQAGLVGNRAGQNIAAREINYSSLPYDPFTVYLTEEQPTRVQSRTDQPYVNRTSIKQTEYAYAFMTHISQALGVNCTYCHNSRSFFPWEGSSPARVTAWHGIRLARDINTNFVTPLEGILPQHRKGPMGDALKANCATCHAGAYKPGFGSRLAERYPALFEAPQTIPVGSDAPLDQDIPLLEPPEAAPGSPEGVPGIVPPPGASRPQAEQLPARPPGQP